LRVRRQQSDEKRCDAHHGQGEDEHRFASDAIAEMTDDDPADRTCDEADRVGPERRKRAGERVEHRKIQSIEHERGSRAVEKEVVPLDRGANQAGEGHRAD
jgi:hypothetical protein